MKNTILLFFTLMITNLLAQNCNELEADESDFCYLKSFFEASPIHNRFDNNYLKYNVGNDEYYPEENYAPWAGYYMPLADGGISSRWKKNEPDYPITSNFHSWNEVKKMSIEELALLSPSEKMDIYLGNKNFALTKNELIRRGPERNPKPKDWEGFCNGVRLLGIELTNITLYF